MSASSIIDPSKLSIEQMFALRTALGTVFNVMSGLLCQPKFYRQNELDEAGEMLDLLQEEVGHAIDALRQEALTRKPVTGGDLRRQVFFAAEDWADGSCEPRAALKGLINALTPMAERRVAA